MDVTRSSFGVTPAGEAAELFTLTGGGGLEVRATNYGGTIVSVLAPDRNGDFANVVLGHESLEDYLVDTRYFGALVGRFANRIAGARFSLDGVTYHVTANEGRHHLHGGSKGFDKVVWRAEPFDDDGSAGVVLSHQSPDGDEGYPGTLDAEVTYTVTAANELIVDYLATTDKATPVSLTQHSYFNLTGSGRDVRDHRLRISADWFVPVDEELIPTGVIAPVAESPFDFRALTQIGARNRVYDHSFLINRPLPGLAFGARVVEPFQGRTLDVFTTEPGLHLYSGNPRGLCLETQQLPDTPNQPAFPSKILQPGSEYRSRTTYAFGVIG